MLDRPTYCIDDIHRIYGLARLVGSSDHCAVCSRHIGQILTVDYCLQSALVLFYNKTKGEVLLFWYALFNKLPLH